MVTESPQFTNAAPLRPARTVRLKRLVPNMITTAALCCGVAALHFAVKTEWDRALGLVAAAAILDALDGRAARFLRVTSPFGATLDSMADFVSFGIAPAFLLFRWRLQELDQFGLIIGVVFALCAAMRLARFTAMAKKGKTTPWGPAYFMGMPTPAAAGTVLIPLLLAESKKLDLELPLWIVAIHTLLIAVLMVSRLPMFSFKHMRIRRSFAVPLLVLVGAVVVAGTRDTWLTLAALSACYLLLLPVSIVMAQRKLPREDSVVAASRGR